MSLLSMFVLVVTAITAGNTQYDWLTPLGPSPLALLSMLVLVLSAITAGTTQDACLSGLGR